MEIISVNFLLFVVGALAVYYLLARRAQNYWLLIVSLVFCATWNIRFAVVLLITTLLNYAIARMIYKSEQRRKAWFFTGLGINLVAFAFFKVISGPYFKTLSTLISKHTVGGLLTSMDILLPIGFSFYIMGAISYLIDIYQKRTTPTTDLIDFSLYMAYFPKLVSGPIEKARVFLPKLKNPRTVDNQMFVKGLSLIAVGVFRKIFIADKILKIIPPKAFTTPSQYTTGTLWLSILFYAFWLYNDFAGYTSIIRGISYLFGIELSPNFQFPYLSQTFSEFWSRWHISLSLWLREYIYFPISRALLRRNPNHSNLINIFIPPLVTMLASGLWHNFSLAMLVWGGMHGIYLAVERLLILHRKGDEKESPVWVKGLKILVIFFLTLLAWTAFATGGLAQIYHFWRGLLLSQGATMLSWGIITVPLLSICASMILDILYFRSKEEVIFYRWPQFAQALLLATFIAAMGINFLWGGVKVTPFIYQGF